MPSLAIPAARSQYLLALLAQAPGPRKKRGRRHPLAGLLAVGVAAVIAGGYVLAVLMLFWYFYPILSGKIIPYSDWLSHVVQRLDLGPETFWRRTLAAYQRFLRVAEAYLDERDIS